LGIKSRATVAAERGVERVEEELDKVDRERAKKAGP
jgi:hypothetical protein